MEAEVQYRRRLVILVVDDHPLVRGGLKEFLEAAGYLVAEAASGEEALEQVRRVGPDLIILDQRLPGLTGLEVARRLRNDPTTAGIRLILYSGEDPPKAVEGLVDLILSKGKSLTALLVQIQRLLETCSEPGPPNP